MILRRHIREVRKQEGRGRKPIKRYTVKVFLRAFELSLKVSSGICWIICL